MVSDTAAIGLIASSCILFVFLVGFTLVTGCICYRRLQRKQKHQSIRRALAPRKDRDRYITDSQSGASSSEVPNQDVGKLANYRPKILGEQNPKPQEEGVSHRSWRDVEHRQHNLTTEGLTVERENSIRTSMVNGRAISVVNVNGSSTNLNVNPRGRREFQTNGHVYEGYVRAPTINTEHLQVHEWQRQSGSRSSQRSGEGIMVGNLVQRSGEPVRGQIIKQNVEVGEGGRLVVTNVEQRMVGQVHGQQSTWGAIVNPAGVGSLQGQIISQNVERGDDGRLMITSTEQRDIGETSQAWSDREQSRYSNLQRESNENNVSPSGLFTPSGHIVEGWRTSSDIAVERLEARQDVPDIVVNDEHGNEATPDSSSSSSSSSSSDADDENEAQEPPAEPVAGEFYNHHQKYKVIKRHSSHKPPDWLVQTYAESASDEETAAREHRDSAVQVEEEIQEAAMSVSSSTKGVRFGTTSTITDDVINTQGGNDDITAVTTWVSGTADHPGGESVTITDYVDPGKAVTTSYQTVEASEDGSVTTTRFTSTSMTATAMRSVRQEVNESAEAIPPAFTSTPRVPWDTQATDTSIIETGRGLVTATTHHRQRSADMGEAPQVPSIVEIMT